MSEVEIVPASSLIEPSLRGCGLYLPTAEIPIASKNQTSGESEQYASIMLIHPRYYEEGVLGIMIAELPFCQPLTARGLPSFAFEPADQQS